MKALKNFWGIICYPLLYISVQLVVSFVYLVVFDVMYILKLTFENMMENGFSADTANAITEEDILEIMSNMNYMIPIIISSLVTALIIFLILIKQWKAEKTWSFKKVKPPVALLSVALGAAANILTICIISIIPAAQQPSPLDDIFGNNFILDLLVAGIFAAALEEIIFRGIVLKRLNEIIKRRHIAVFLQALMFGVIHFSLVQGIYAFFLGIFIGYIYLWFDSIWYAIIIHFAYNATNVLLPYIFGDTEVNLYYFLISSALVFIVSMATLVALAEKKEKEDLTRIEK